VSLPRGVRLAQAARYAALSDSGARQAKILRWRLRMSLCRRRAEVVCQRSAYADTSEQAPPLYYEDMIGAEASSKCGKMRGARYRQEARGDMLSPPPRHIPHG